MLFFTRGLQILPSPSKDKRRHRGNHSVNPQREKGFQSTQSRAHSLSLRPVRCDDRRGDQFSEIRRAKIAYLLLEVLEKATVTRLKVHRQSHGTNNTCKRTPRCVLDSRRHARSNARCLEHVWPPPTSPSVGKYRRLPNALVSNRAKLVEAVAPENDEPTSHSLIVLSMRLASGTYSARPPQ